MQNKKNELAFGRIPAYCRYELFMERYRSAAEIIRGQYVLNANTKFLDVGCGEGYMKYFFDSDEGEWHGIETSKDRVVTSEKLGYTVSNIDINKTPFPYPDGFFDVVLASHVIEHLSGLDFCLQQMDRVLKKGGIMLIATPTKPPGIAWLVELLHKMGDKQLGDTQHAFSSFSLKKLVKSRLEGYQLIDCRGFRIFSARKRLNLENNYSFYRVSTFLGKHLTLLVPEVNVIYKKMT